MNIYLNIVQRGQLQSNQPIRLRTPAGRYIFCWLGLYDMPSVSLDRKGEIETQRNTFAPWYKDEDAYAAVEWLVNRGCKG